MGSKSDVMFVPLWGEPFWPPTTITRPSASVDWPAQCRSPNVAGVSVKVPVDGSQTRALSPVDQTSTLPVESIVMCLACWPQSRIGPQLPLSIGAASALVSAAAAGLTTACGAMARTEVGAAAGEPLAAVTGAQMIPDRNRPRPATAHGRAR